MAEPIVDIRWHPETEIATALKKECEDRITGRVREHASHTRYRGARRLLVEVERTDRADTGRASGVLQAGWQCNGVWPADEWHERCPEDFTEAVNGALRACGLP
jgi:hypothetical protein